MFRLTTEPIDLASLRSALAHPRAGAGATFEGWVRDHNDGQGVEFLEYEAYLPLAETEGNRILAEARTKFAIIEAMGVHRTGRLRVGDLAVWVGVSAEHRGAAFEACRYIIDELKARVPIWKKEHYAAGSTQWIGSTAHPAKSQTERA